MKLILVILFLLLSLDSFADLSCSANGLNILYINGVNVDKAGNLKSTGNVQGAINPIKPDVDRNKVSPVQGVWNTSRSLLSDIEKLKAQLAANHQGKKRAGFWQSFANLTYSPFNNSKEFTEALEQITSGKNIPKDENGNVIDQDFYSKADFYKDLVIYNPKLANLLANASSDVAVVTEMKTRIKAAYKNGTNKVIIVSHSQGNEVTYSAINELRKDTSFLTSNDDIKKFDGLMGYMQVAPPSPRLITSTDGNFNFYSDHAQYIRTDADMVIGSSAYITGISPVSSNYFTTSYINGVSKIFNASNWIESTVALLTGYSGGLALHHGMDDIYLSNSYFARRENTILPKAMVEHFKDNMREIASKLQDNCSTPDIDIEVVGAIKSTTTPGTFDYQGTTSYSNNLNITAKDKNDTDDSTVFTYRYKVYDSTVYFNCGGCNLFTFNTPIEPGLPTNTINNFSIPFSHANYTLVVNAINKFGRTATRNFTITVKEDQAPAAAIVSYVCDTGVSSNDSDGRVYVETTGYSTTLFDITDPDSSFVSVKLAAVFGYNSIDVASLLAAGEYNYSYHGKSGGSIYFSSTDGAEVSATIPECAIGTKLYTGANVNTGEVSSGPLRP